MSTETSSKTLAECFDELEELLQWAFEKQVLITLSSGAYRASFLVPAPGAKDTVDHPKRDACKLDALVELLWELRHFTGLDCPCDYCVKTRATGVAARADG